MVALRIMVVQESDWVEKGPHQSHHLMERLSEDGHEIRVIDYEIGWRKLPHKGLISKRRVFEKCAQGKGERPHHCSKAISDQHERVGLHVASFHPSDGDKEAD